jgi:hypothetical protein
LHIISITGKSEGSPGNKLFKQMQRITIILFTGLLCAFIIGAAFCSDWTRSYENWNYPVPQCSDSTLKYRPHPAIGDFNVYYGGFHNHTSISDGCGSPQYAYGLSDHDSDRDSVNWRAVMDSADSCNVDGVFATFRGFEWTSSTYGHITIVNTDDFTGTASNQTFQQFCAWLSTQQNGFAIFNHPGREDTHGMEFGHFQDSVCEKIVGLELWNKIDPFFIYYYNNGYAANDTFKGFYDEALSRGWKIGAAGGFDDHTCSWGTASDFRLAVLAKNLTRRDILDAMMARRFFSTEDKNIALSFTIAGQEMGSTIGGGVSHSAPLQIRAFDDDKEIFTEVVLFDKDHNKRRTWNQYEAAIDISDTLAVTGGDYYYVKVKQRDGNEAVSSPIWVSDRSANGEGSADGFALSE